MEPFRSLRESALQMRLVPAETRNQILRDFAKLLRARRAELLATSDWVWREHASELTPALAARLRLSETSIENIALSVESVARLPDPVFQVLERRELDSGLLLEKIRVPIGVCAVIFESRADVVPQIASLSLKSANGLILKGGRESEAINLVYADILQEVACMHPTFPPDWFFLSHQRELVDQILTARGEVDLLIPRGSRQLIDDLSSRSQVPILGHADGVCHIFVDSSADLEQALPVILDAKLQYPAACNSLETLLLDRSIANSFLQSLIPVAEAHGLKLRGCAECVEHFPSLDPVSDEDWHREYGDATLACKVVSNIDHALDHIQVYGSGHTDGILAQNEAAQAYFFARVDSACAFANCSTRFADGFRFGLGAEIGIGTGKLHARGPVGMEGLMTYQYRLQGKYHQVSDYVSGHRTFTHRELDSRSEPT